ncbi:diacylglycerol/lipid kinase family protein [Sunxiuqinia sp. A32]|uniref:diacylglycerol/lipid kinase family protein n=1 Tax=Sunxiuqinia sp. A32 TaxID=3461496 RepID=UPI00404670DA
MSNIFSDKWMLILNPHAGVGRGKKDKDKIIHLLRKKDIHFDLLVSSYPTHAIPLTVAAIKTGYRKLIVAGGDGTLNEVVNGVFQQDECSPDEIVVGMIPVGTGNDWIKTFQIPNNYKSAIKKLLKGKTIQQDVGRITYEESGNKKTRIFANMAGFGFDAMVAEKANRLKNKGRSGLLVYLQSLGASYLQYQTRKVRIAVDGQEVEDFVFSASIGIGKYNGGGMMQAPNAVPNNGIFEVTIIHKIGFWGIVRNLPGLFNGSYIKDRRVSSFQAKHVSITSEKSIPGEVDGETLGNHQFDIEILPSQLNVIIG